MALLLFLVTAAGLAAGGAAWLAGVGQAADVVWLGDVGVARDRIPLPGSGTAPRPAGVRSFRLRG